MPVRQSSSVSGSPPILQAIAATAASRRDGASYKLQAQQGVSLIEIITTVAILVIVAVIVIVGYQSFRRQVDLETVSLQVANSVDRARGRTLSSESDTTFGVHFETDQYVTFQGPTYDANDPDNEATNLPNDTEIYDISLTGGGSDVAFAAVTGQTSASGTVSLRRVSEPSQTTVLTILPQGQVSLDATVNPTDTREADTRHIHFDLGWSIQDASELTLTFSNPSHVETVAMADYFNSDHTDFDWEDAVDVNGSSQTIHINTHSLDAADTVLSIHRDRRLNDVAVTISIEGNEIVSYAADGTATVGDSGGTMTVQ